MSHRRDTAEVIAANIRREMTLTGSTEEMLSEATDMQRDTLRSRLSGETQFSVAELLLVGGFLRFSPATLLEGAGA